MDAAAPSKPRQRFTATVTRNTRLCNEHYRLILRIACSADFPATWPGQFIQLGCGPEVGDESRDDVIEWPVGQAPRLAQQELTEPRAFLRRPFSLAGRQDTPQGTELTIIYRVVGLGTQWLQSLKAGDATDLIGPLGNRFTFPQDKSIGLMVGGGVGLPPMLYLAEAMRQAGWEGCAFVGATTADLLPITWTDTPPDTTGQPAQSIEEFSVHAYPAVVTTDDGSLGLRGLITDGLTSYMERMNEADRRRAVIFTCGPHGMMAAVAALAQKYGVDCQACLEQAMACGVGTCQSCIVKIREEDHPHDTLPDSSGWRYRLTCTDGPVFEAHQVIW